MSLEQLLFQLGINITSSAVYDLIKLFPTTDGFTKALESRLEINNAIIEAQTILEFLAQRGDITISGTSIFAQDSISMQSARGTKVVFGDGSVSTTKNTRIIAGNNSRMVMQGGAQVRQNVDGSISFYV